MKAPISWLRDFVDINLPLPELAYRLTMAGLEVENIRSVGMPISNREIHDFAHEETKIEGISWDPERIITAAVSEVMPHPNADRLVLCRLFDGIQEHIVLTGAPNLYPYKGQGVLLEPLKVAYAKEGAKIYDGHQPGQVLTTLKRTKIRGIDSYSMICSEKELGISDEHEGVIILDEDAPVGIPLVDYMGDAVLDIAITPNIARASSILGIAREIAALTDQALRQPDLQAYSEGPPIQGKVAIQIHEPQLNPRFVLGLIEGVENHPSPYWAQRRLRLAGMRPIDCIVDATNFAMLELGEPLHAFDYDVLVERAHGQPPTIITRSAEQGEHLTTLDGIDHILDNFTVLVCDTAGALSIAGVMGGAETEVKPKTRNVLLEGASWNFINIRRTISAQRMDSEAAFRFSRGVHPELAAKGVKRCLELMRQWSGGRVYQGLIDAYPLPPVDPVLDITRQDVKRSLGINLSSQQIANLLNKLEFQVDIHDDHLRIKAPDHRLDIGEGVIGVADLMEEIARIYGYENIPETRLDDELPPHRNNPSLDREERIRDLLVNLGLQEVVNYRLTSPAREARRLPPSTPADDKPYVTLANPIASDRYVLRHSILASLFENLERNNRTTERIAIFEIGPVFYFFEEENLPDEMQRLGMLMAGPRNFLGWQPSDTASMDFYDLKGVIESLLQSLGIINHYYEPSSYPVFHPGKCARVCIADNQIGVFGEVHPQVHDQYDWPRFPVLAGWIDLSLLSEAIPESKFIQAVAAFPPVLEDLAIIVDENIPAARVEKFIRLAGGKNLNDLRLFDVYRGGQIGAGKKSLAYSLKYQSFERTLTDQEVARIRQRIVHQIENELGGRIRSSNSS